MKLYLNNNNNIQLNNININNIINAKKKGFF